ncbi:HesB/IscA family protein [Thermolongibacillus altinsuensis]|jgi:iron-sulfur cluster assembly protein|uniref:HesB/IscA family protein n=1 Tax=Thermolongibacillus altinsuensis TaxID=575256 RepID=UPI00242A2F52|nr:iron-sulfur cluster assembly accessory protein [Thermolongibacillus altinsuensis]GMB09011.1 hypothetical protein B1no1_17210 [Thermolongibacillus altinsuensis]
MSEIVILTESAASQIKQMMKESGEENAYFRIGVYGGGCSGLSYAMGFDHEKREKDHESVQHGVRILVDDESALVLKGTVIDYKEAAMGGGFTINNPNAIASCGCGSSFRTATNAGKPEEC